jgi:hypothetical protein
MGSIFDSPVTLSMTVLRRTDARARPRSTSHSSGVNASRSANARGVHDSGSIDIGVSARPASTRDDTR